jgi:hypothetical protein
LAVKFVPLVVIVVEIVGMAGSRFDVDVRLAGLGHLGHG